MDQKAIITAFLEEAFKKENLTLDDQTIDRLAGAVRLTEAEGDLSKEQRAVKLEQDSSGKISASSFKLYNIAQVSLYDLLGFLGKEMGLIAFEDTPKKVIFGLAMLLHEFWPKLTVNFNEQEAQTLYAIAQLGQKTFTTPELKETFDRLFETQMPEESLEAGLEVLVQHHVIERTAVKAYRLEEKIKNLRRTP
jgi:hypothetical protein